MSARDIALAFIVVAIWGTNFVVIKWGLRDFPPFLLVALRFVFSALPFVLFLPRPRTPWRWLVLYGVCIGVVQFGLLFHALQGDIAPGLASLVIQAQVYFTIALSAWIFHERVTAVALAGCALGAAGFVLIAASLDAASRPIGVAAVLGAAMGWAAANIALKKAVVQAEGGFGMLAFIAWSSVFAVPPLVALSLAFEGPSAIAHAFATARPAGWAAAAWQVVGNTLFAFSVWGYLLRRYDAAVVTPYALLVPVFGMASSALVLGEALGAWKLAGGALVLAGIAAIVLRGSRRASRPDDPEAAAASRYR